MSHLDELPQLMSGAERLGVLSVLASDLDHPECVTLGPDGNVFAGGEAGQVYRIDPIDGSVLEIASIGSPIGGVVADGDGSVFVCDPARHRVVRVGLDARVETFVDGGDGLHMTQPNSMVFDAAGTLFLSDSGRWGKDNGLIWTVSPAGEARTFSQRVREYPNGLALDPANEYLYAIESSASRVVRMRVGAGVDPIIDHVLDLPGDVPDGLAFDAAGNLFVACYRRDRIYRLRKGGELDLYLDDWAGVILSAPTNVAFYGPRLERMVIASHAGQIVYSLGVDDPGMPLHYPRGLRLSQGPRDPQRLSP